MRIIPILLTFFHIILKARCFAQGNLHVLHETRSESSSWTSAGRADSHLPLRLRIALTQTNLEKGDELLLDVSHPNSRNYGKHYTVEEVVSLFAPNQETIDKVKDWLISSGIEEQRIAVTDNRGWIVFDAWIHEAERLLNTEYKFFRHATRSHLALGADNYFVPKHLRDHIEFITPGVALVPYTKPRPRSLMKRSLESTKQSPSPGPLANCQKAATPECISKLYKIPSPSYKNANPNNTLGIYSFGGSIGYDQYDLDNYFTHFTHGRIPNGTHPIDQLIDGATGLVSGRPENVDYEELLDFMVAYPIIYPQQITHFPTDDADAENFVYEAKHKDAIFNDFLDAVDGTYCTYCAYGECGNAKGIDPPYPNPGYKHKPQCGVYRPPNVISFSYADPESYNPPSYSRRQCSEFMKLGLRGITVVFASGDHGVGNAPVESKENPKYLDAGCLGSNQTIFNPEYPASCPYVTAVGATSLLSSEPDYANERTAHYSGGGFSNVFDRPSYQSDAVSAYLKDHNPGYVSYVTHNGTPGATGRYNRAGRAYPDLCALGTNYPIFAQSYQKGHSVPFLEFGTSVSTPLVAAVFTRINEERLANNKSTIGFVNPALYSHPEMLRDVVRGRNSGNTRKGYLEGGQLLPKFKDKYPDCGTDGFEAVKGWDAASGLGSPDYPKMMEYFMSLP